MPGIVPRLRVAVLPVQIFKVQPVQALHNVPTTTPIGARSVPVFPWPLGVTTVQTHQNILANNNTWSIPPLYIKRYNQKTTINKRFTNTRITPNSGRYDSRKARMVPRLFRPYRGDVKNWKRGRVWAARTSYSISPARLKPSELLCRAFFSNTSYCNKSSCSKVPTSHSNHPPFAQPNNIM